MFQTFLPNYWAVSRGGEWVQRYILKSSAKFQTSWTISTKPQSWCFINNQHHNVQGCIIFLYLCDPNTKTNEYSWCNLGYKSGIPKTSAVNQAQKHLYRMLGMFHYLSTECDTNPHKSLQKRKKKWHWRKHSTAHPTEFWTVPHLINQIRPTQGVKQQIFRKIQTHGRSDSISVSTQMKLN